jgi:hypothetical protein
VRKTKLKYRLFSAADGGSQFWHWEVYRGRVVLDSGFMSGSKAAVQERVAIVITRLSPSIKNERLKNRQAPSR